MAVVSTGKIGLIIPGWSAVPTGGKGGGMKRMYVLNDGILSLSMVIFYSAKLK